MYGTVSSFVCVLQLKQKQNKTCISNTRNSVSSDFQRPRREPKTLCIYRVEHCLKFFIIVTFHAKTYTSGFLVNG